MKKILMTFDYEIFFGTRSGTPEKCIIEPTNRLLDILCKADIKSVFFIDVLYYTRLLESVVTRPKAEMIKKQLQTIVKQGSRIELHLHPHWLDAEYYDGEWKFKTYDRFRLQSLSDHDIIRLFQTGKQVLESIAREVDPTYTITAFRAGGFCIQPFSCLKAAFINSQICIDSSVAPGFFGESQTHRFDFRNAHDQAVYQFEDNPNLVVKDGSFSELSIATYKKSILAKLRIKLWKVFFPEKFKSGGDGCGLYFPIPIWKKILPSVRMFTLDAEMLPNELIQQIEKSNREIVTIISHPKSLSEMSYICISQLLDKNYEFIGINEAIKAQTII